MERSERLATSVTEDQKRKFRVLAAQRNMNMSELLYELVEDALSEAEREGNAPPTATVAN